MELEAEATMVVVLEEGTLVALLVVAPLPLAVPLAAMAALPLPL